uniref:Uncharacterized protein n=1 Tax=Rhizophora mucronata TaxID=61149 RepID=A0A2P2N461_RHIMU
MELCQKYCERSSGNVGVTKLLNGQEAFRLFPM